ncbi:spondin domain-containing protein [Hymenobacter metallicola]|nr:spondin domain-containing protein [Hymenobacter metallicola]
MTLVLAACAPTPEAKPEPERSALYRVSFVATWSAATHPGSYPAGAHFSPLIGASHEASDETRLFRVGTPASPGIKNMAELGNNTALRTEINALRGQQKAFRLLDGRVATASPGTLTDTLRVSLAHPLVSVVTMIAPSPDWFVGITGESLLNADQTWAATRTIPAASYDAGTDSGPDYASADQPTTPAEPIRAVPHPAGPLGYFLLERLK